MGRIPFFLFMLLCSTASGQTDSLPPYLKDRSLPDFRLLRADGKTWLTKADLAKGKPVMLMLFNPDCDHCQKQTWALRQGIDRLGDLQIVMATYRSVKMIGQFDELYELYKFPSIRTGRDEEYRLIPYYQVKGLPLMALYDAGWRLLDTVQGDQGIEPILKVLGR